MPAMSKGRRCQIGMSVYGTIAHNGGLTSSMNHLRSWRESSLKWLVALLRTGIADAGMTAAYSNARTAHPGPTAAPEKAARAVAQNGRKTSIQRTRGRKQERLK